MLYFVPQALPHVALLIVMLFFIYAVIGMQVRILRNACIPSTQVQPRSLIFQRERRLILFPGYIAHFQFPKIFPFEGPLCIL